jgi:hypothetical protein
VVEPDVEQAPAGRVGYFRRICSVTVVVRARAPAVPEIHSVYVPVLVVVVVCTLRVDVVDVGFGENDAAALAGRPLALSVTASVKPPDGAIETAYDAVPPRTID